jgi:cytochrome bd ubiquinol oxidase subunit II
MLPDLTTPAGWMPVVFMLLMGVALMLYVVLDGYDLGVGMLVPVATDAEKDTMISSIGPFWDANETWLVLGIGLLLVAFPRAHGVILTALYLPVVVMLIGLMVRGVAFDFRVKARDAHKSRWNKLFWAGSLLTSLAQGYMLGSYITGFQASLSARIFAVLTALCLPATYMLLGSGWLIMKTEGELQRKAVAWAKRAWWGVVLGFTAISIASPLVSERIFQKWFQLPYMVLLAPIPLITVGLLLILLRSLTRLSVRLQQSNEYGTWVPFACTVGVVVLGFYGLAYSMFPYLVVDRLTIWDAASDPEALGVILVGAVVVLPAILAYTVFVYRVFRGKAQPLTYG